MVLSILIAGLGLCLAPFNARADIKELIIEIGVNADTFNPQEQTTTLFQNICDLIYDNLFFQDPDGKLEPPLAKGYQVSNDGLVWTINTSEGVTFSDGTPFDAKAAKLTFDRALHPKMRVPLRFAISMIKECAIVDGHTIQFEIGSQPYFLP